MRTALPAIFALLFAASCGGEASPSAGLTVRFQLSKGGTTLVACKDVEEVTEVKVKLFGADGLTLLPGYPKTADCTSAVFTDANVMPGSYTLEVVATGDLFGDPAAPLFKIRREVTLPADNDVTIALSPEVAFLAVSWTFSTTNDLSPCNDEVDTVSLFLGSGAGGSGTFSKTNLACALGTFTIPTPLAAQNYTVKLDAYAQQTGNKLYDVDEMRLLERGANPTFAVVFEPVGGRLLFDWQFAPQGSPLTAACDDAGVGVTSLSLRLTSRAGDDPIELTIPCAAPRPYAVPGVRYTQAKLLDLTLVAEGVHRFVAKRAITTTAGDTDLGSLQLVAVGSSTVTVVRTATTACPADLDSIAVAVTPAGGRMPLITGSIDATGGIVPVLDVPLGEYDVEVEGVKGALEVCRVFRREIITGRTNRWSDIEL